MFDQTLQGSLFEEDYLLRELGQVAHAPQVALTELVANSWDAGATKVELIIPDSVGNTMTITDNGHGMTSTQFKKRWMTLRYNRLKHQGDQVEFPDDSKAKPRIAFGRNGVGRHGLLCFADQYEVQTWRDGTQTTFTVGTESGPSPFVLKSENQYDSPGHGTRLSVQILRKLPDPEEILTVLSTRFLHDPEFEIFVNGVRRPFAKIQGRVSTETIEFGEGRTATVIVIDSTRQNQSSVHQGIAFWVQRRLVGAPSWAVGQVANFDGRTRFAKRYKVIVDTNGFESEVEQDWTAFKSSPAVKELFEATAKHVEKIAKQLANEVADSSSEDALTRNRIELATLGQGARLEVAEFTKIVAQQHPTVSPDFLATAVQAVIHLEKTKSGAALLQKLSSLSNDDINGLDRLLNEWDVKDALQVLDEIDNRLSVIETIRRLANDPTTDELHTLHPLILRSRWLFGPEFESLEFCSNVTLQTVAKELFKDKEARFINERNRPDIVVLPEKTTLQMTGIESFDPIDSSIIQLQHVLLIELKKGGFELTRKEVNQADGYVQDIATSSSIGCKPFISAWVVGQKIAAGVARDKEVGDENRKYGRIRATTFAALVDTANTRLLKLRNVLSTRYEETTTDQLLKRVFSTPKQQVIEL